MYYSEDGPSIAVTAAPAVSSYNSAYGLTSSYYSAPKVAIAPAVSKVFASPSIATYTSGPTVSTLGIAPTISSYVSPAKVAYSSAPAVSTYYSANKLAYSATPSFGSAAYLSAPVKQVAYATPAPAVTQYVSPYSSAYASNYGSSYGISKVGYASPTVTSTYGAPAISSSYIAANKYAYTGPNVATQYASTYSPSLSASYISAPIAKQGSYATNPLLNQAYVSGYKSGAYIAPAVATTSYDGAGLVKTSGYTSSLG